MGKNGMSEVSPEIKAYLGSLGKIGGSRKTEKKVKASRENMKKINERRKNKSKK